jgi:ATP-dependent exoDNAse (exonuclease V) beta subunit
MSISDAAQRAQAIDPLASYCVSAPAGSGKTELLIQRVLALLVRVRQPEQVLAITFTRKAAAEMRERLSQALADAAADLSCDSEHQRITRSLAAAVLAHSERCGWRLLDDSARLNIKTIDSFCAGLTRQLPVMSRFGGQVATVDDPAELYAEAVQELYSLLDVGHEVAADLRALLLHFDNNWQRVGALMAAMLGRRDQWYQTMGGDRSPAEAESALMALVGELVDDHLAQLHEMLSPWRQRLADLLQYSAEHLEREAVPGFPPPERTALAQWQALREMLLTAEGGWRKQVNKRNGFPASDKRSAEQVALFKTVVAELTQQPELAAAIGALAWLPRMEAGSRSWELVLALSHVLPVLAACLTLVFQRRSVVDHTEVALSALNALGEDETPTELALRLDYQLEHILVDEFQDTAINQYQLIQRLTRGWAEHNSANPEAPRTLFVVGDGMQSIYGFRDANVGLFLRARDQGFNGVRLAPLALSSNFRSDAGVVDWVNTVFTQAFPAVDDARRGRVSFTPATAVRASVHTQAVQLHCFSRDDSGSTENEFLVAQIRAALADSSVNSIALLGRSRNQLAPVLAALREAGVDYCAQDLDPLTRSPAIHDLMLLCRVLANPADRIAWLALLRAPWAGFTLADLLAVRESMAEAELDSLPQWLAAGDYGAVSAAGQQALQHLAVSWQWAQARRDRRALRVYVECLWRELGCHRDLSLSELQEAEVFFGLLQRAERETQGLDVTWLQHQLQRLFAQGGDSDAKLQVMTLHKAKGLEFDCVFIPALERGTRSSEREMLLWDEYVSPRGERGFLLAADDHSDDKDSSLYNYLRAQRKLKERLENARLLYVGVTRGVARVVMTASLGLSPSGSQRAPADNSLLATIWPYVKDTALIHAVPDQPSELVDEHLMGRPLRRLCHTPLHQLSLAQSQTTDSNLPARHFNRLERHVGTVIHAALERLAGRPAMPQAVSPDDTARWRLQLRALGLAGDLLEVALARVNEQVAATLADEAGRWLLADHPEGGVELALTTRDVDGVIRDLVVDRTFVDAQTGERWIVDYKSSSPASDEPLEKFLQREAQHYAPQLAGYARALALPNQRVRCALYFTALGRLHELSSALLVAQS